MHQEELLHKIALTMIPNIGPILSKNLIAYCGSPAEIFAQKKGALAKIPGIGSAKVNDILRSEVMHRAEEELNFISKNNIHCLYFLDEEYPSRLKHFDYSPILLYYRGDVALLNTCRTVGIVGTRNPTDRARSLGKQVVMELASYAPTIISGLAHGIDSIAHKEAMANGLPTIGVMGNGHDIVYPAAHRELVSKMAECGGLLTEFPSKTKPDRVNFPMRNRIIAALSDALIVMESNVSGGSIITAEFANEYNKDVFAIPGRIDDEKSKGCNALIKRHKAHLMETVQDLIYITRWDGVDQGKPKQASMFIELGEDESKVLNIIKEKKEITIDELVYQIGMPISSVVSILLHLEFQSLIMSLPGKKYRIA